MLQQSELTNKQIQQLMLDSEVLITGPNQFIGGDYHFRSIGQQSNVKGEHLLVFARAVLALARTADKQTPP